MNCRWRQPQAGIIEEADHDTLMAQGGHYAELYNTCYRHRSPDYVPVPGYAI